MKRLLERIKLWWNGTPVPVKPERTYSIAGWVRGEDGVYRNEDQTIFRRGRTWIRSAGLGPDFDQPYPTLHAAIKNERPAVPEADAPLFPCPHGEKVGLCSKCNED